MKIAISATGENKTDLMDSRFARCAFFQIYDTETKELSSVKNVAQDQEGGAGVASAQQIIDLGVNLVISWKVGPNAYGLFKKAGIKMLTSECISIAEIIEAYNKGDLKEIEEAGPAHHGS